jgi:hypothetical protein
MSYIYIRDNEWYKQHNVYKVGITTSIKDRNSTYITGEIIRGEFIKIYELTHINEERLKIIDKLFKKIFLHLNKYHNGGTEFYDRIIIDQIEIFLENLKIKYDIIDDKELKIINRNCNKIIKDLSVLISKYINMKSIIIKPKDYQIEILNKIDEFYDKNNIGKLLWACGLGKTIMSLFITKQLNLEAMFSYGDWFWNSTKTIFIPQYDSLEFSFDAKGVHVGDAAHTGRLSPGGNATTGI